MGHMMGLFDHDWLGIPATHKMAFLHPGPRSHDGVLLEPQSAAQSERTMALVSRMIADMRVVDIYRRDGDKLAENWVFIDLLHYLSMQGLDVLGRLKELRRAG